MWKTFRSAALAGILSSVAIALAALPMTSLGAAAAMKKKAAAGHMKGHSSMKGHGGMKSGAAKSSGKGNGGDPLNDAAGKKM